MQVFRHHRSSQPCNGGADAAVEHQAQREAHIPKLRAAGSGLQFFHLLRRQRLDGLFV